MSVHMVPCCPGAPPSAGQTIPRLVRMFAALSATNEAVLRINSQENLFQQVCEAALHSGNFVAAAILLRKSGTDTLKAVAAAGDDGELRAGTYSVSENSPAGHGLVGIAFRTCKPCVSNDLLNDERLKAWHQ